jgi:hypothetical protein
MMKSDKNVSHHVVKVEHEVIGSPQMFDTKIFSPNLLPFSQFHVAVLTGSGANFVHRYELVGLSLAMSCPDMGNTTYSILE